MCTLRKDSLTMKNLLCENPAIILNHSLKWLVLTHGNYTIRGEYVELPESILYRWHVDFPYGLFGTKKLGITLDDIDNCYITDKFTGDLIPIYMAVPCNKCTLCRDKHAREWSTRAMCESQTSTGYPLFVTLTYNNWSKPIDGVDKRHVQLFIKRLRMYVNRYMQRDVNLRFFLCAEYGSKTKRPHYHALIWNFPLMDSLKRTLSILEKSWSYVVSRKNLCHVPHECVFYDDKANRYRAQFGFVHVQMAQGGHVKYCMKYMRKDAVIPKGKNPVFFLSSRRRGIGYQWLSDNIEEYFRNPQLSDVTFRDKWSGATYTAALPSYYKGILFPTMSKIVPKDVRDAFGRFVYLLNCRTSLLGHRELLHDEIRLLTKYRQLPQYLPEYVDDDFVNGIRIENTTSYDTYIPIYMPYVYSKNVARFGTVTCVPKIGLHSVECIHDYVDDFDDVNEMSLNYVEKSLVETKKILTDYSYNDSIFDDSQLRKNIRLYWLNKKIETQPQLQIVDAVRQIKWKRSMQLNRELL